MTPADILTMPEPPENTVLIGDDFAQIWRRQGERWHDLTELGVGPQTWEYVSARLARCETVQVATLTPLAGTLPAVDNTALIRRAIADPKQFTERHGVHDAGPGEALSAWQARAVVIALGGGDRSAVEPGSLKAYIRAWGDAGSDQACARCLTTIVEGDRSAIVGPLPGVICTLCARLISEGVTWIQGGAR